MQAPKCKVCQVAHWGGEHVWPKEVRRQLERAAKRARPQAAAVTVKPVVNTQPAAVNAAAVNTPSKAPDRAAYMRDLMRKRRAASKS